MDVYGGKHQGSQAVERYWRKLSNRIDRLRHGIEHDVLSVHAYGAVFDCTIGVGRFLGTLPKVTSESGMDISEEFVSHVREAHQNVMAVTGDLSVGIAEPDNRFDTVICLRSLSAIGGLAAILPDMVRIAKPGGHVIVDYGRRPVTVTLNGQAVTTDGEDFDGIVRDLNADTVARVFCDGLLTRLKRRGRIFRFFTQGPGRYIPDSMLLGLERMAVPLFWERQIVVLRKRMPDRA